jgi:tetratricopeptide (TPR) repeat protein
MLLLALPASALPSAASVREPATPERRSPPAFDSELASGAGDVVLVLPLGQAGGPEQPDWLGEGAARYLTEALGLAGYRVVDEEDRRAALQQAGLAGAPRIPRASALVLARGQGARFVITGHWTLRSGRIHLHARAMDAVRMSLVREVEAEAGSPERALEQLAERLTGEAGRVSGVHRSLSALARTTPAALAGWMQSAAEPEQAVDHLRAALELEPGFEPARLALAEALLDAGRPEEVGASLDGITRSKARHRRARAGALEGRLALALGDRDAAVRSLSAAAQELPETGTLLWLAEAQLAAGDSAAAGQTVRQALAQSPSDEAALELLARTRRAGGAP